MATALTPHLSDESRSRSTRSARRSAPSGDQRPDELREFRDPFAVRDLGRLLGVRGRAAGDGRGGAGGRADRERARGPALDACDGKNNGYGGPAPRVDGSVLVTLRNMNRVLEIDEDCAYAVVEPGVRWFDLYDAIRAAGSRLMLSVARPRLGQRRRQRPRQRHHVPPDRLRT